MTRKLISTVLIIALTIGAIVYCNRLDAATTELEAIRNGFKMLLCILYVTGVGIIVRMENKD